MEINRSIWVYVNGNRLTELPDVSPLTNLTDLYVYNNKFTFEDIEPNIGVASATFGYSPQDSVGMPLDTTVAEGDSITFAVNVGGSNNNYQWYYNGNPISDATGTSYTLSSVTSGDAGEYTCAITNSLATDLTLWRRTIHLKTQNVSEPPVVEGIWPSREGTCAIADYAVVKFDRPMDMTGIENSIALWGTLSGDIPFTVYPMDTLVVIAPQKPYYSLEGVTVTVMGDIADLWGNTLDGDWSGTSDGTPADDYTWDFNVTAAGDFNADRYIDFTDLMQFRRSWFSNPQETLYELAPFSGNIPEIKVEPDGLVDFDDLMVLAKMWNWARYNLAKPVPSASLTKSTSSIEPTITLQPAVNKEADVWTAAENRNFSLDLLLREQRPVAGFSYSIHLNPEVFAYESFEVADSLREDRNWLVLHHFDRETSILTVDMVNFGGPSDESVPVAQPGRIRTSVRKEGVVTLNGLLDVRLKNDSTQNYMGTVSYDINTASRMPEDFMLRRNFPNPFSDYTNIRYAVPGQSEIRLMIFDIRGEKVHTVFEGTQEPGYYTETWDGKNGQGIEMSSGMYFLVLQTPGQTFRNKMILVK